ERLGERELKLTRVGEHGPKRGALVENEREPRGPSRFRLPDGAIPEPDGEVAVISSEQPPQDLERRVGRRGARLGDHALSAAVPGGGRLTSHAGRSRSSARITRPDASGWRQPKP